MKIRASTFILALGMAWGWAKADPAFAASLPPASTLGATGAPARGTPGPRGEVFKRVPALTPVLSSPMEIGTILVKFEREVSSSAEVLAKLQTERLGSAAHVDRLKGESASLRKKIEGGSNVLIEARLKVVLGELRSKLEAQSVLEGRWEERRREFIEKALSLLSLYNDRIEMEIASSEVFLNPAGSQKRLDSLVDTARKRIRLQELLNLYQGSAPAGTSETSAWSPASLPPSRDRESLQMTLRLLKDRRREVETRIEQSTLREEEIQKEIRLQERMREFMDDIEHMRENAAFPLPGAKRRDLEWFRGKDHITRLRERLLQVRRQREKDQITLIKLDAYLDQMNYQLKVLKGKGGMKP